MNRNGLFVGVDPGTKDKNLGFALVNEQGELVYCDAVRPIDYPTPPAPPDKWAEHLWTLQCRISYVMSMINKFSFSDIVLAGIEDQWFGKNPQVTMTLSKQWGVVFGILSRYGIYSIRIQPTQGKKALTGSGRATKEQMVQFAQQMGMSGDNDNVADAIGIALAARAIYKEWEIGNHE